MVDNDFQDKITELESEVVRLRQLLTILVERNEWFQKVFNACPYGIIVSSSEFELIDANFAFLNMLGYNSFSEIKKYHLKDLVIPVDWFEKNVKALDEFFNSGYATFEQEYLNKDGITVPIFLTAWLTTNEKNKPNRIVGFIEDNSQQVQVKRELYRKDQELLKMAQTLEEQDTALRIFMKYSKEDKKEFEDNIVLNIKEIIIPYIEKIHKTGLNNIQKNYVEIIKSHLEQIISPFYSKLTFKNSDLTPTEIRIAGLVKDGKTSKEIAQLLHLSAGTIEFHRNNLRKKLGLRNTKTNLRSHLLSME